MGRRYLEGTRNTFLLTRGVKLLRSPSVRKLRTEERGRGRGLGVVRRRRGLFCKPHCFSTPTCLRCRLAELGLSFIRPDRTIQDANLYPSIARRRGGRFCRGGVSLFNQCFKSLFACRRMRRVVRGELQRSTCSGLVRSMLHRFRSEG